MRIILSPAKKMAESDAIAPGGLPVFLPETEKIMAWMKTLTLPEAKKLWACNDALAAQNFERFANMDLRKRLSPALLTYEGIAFQYMAPVVFEQSMIDYVQEHLRILSGFYGVLRPLDGVTPYRLEMQAKAHPEGAKDLYEFWGDRLYKEVVDESHIIVNLASKEYYKCIQKYLQKEDVFVTCNFAERNGERLVQKGVYCKMARGEMVRFMAENQIEDVERIKEFDRLGYRFCEELSTDREYVFLKED